MFEGTSKARLGRIRAAGLRDVVYVTLERPISAGFKNVQQRRVKTNPTPAILQQSAIHSELGRYCLRSSLVLMGDQMKRVLVLVGIALAASPAMAEPTQFTIGNSNVEAIDGHPSKLTIHTVAPMSNEIRILGGTHTTAGCDVLTRTSYQIIEPPQNGTLCFRMENTTLKVGSKCVGQEVPAWIVYYRPNGPYVRQDSFKYSTIVAHTVVAMNTADITITKSPAPFPEELAARAPQIPGPMRRCPDPASKAAPAP